MLQPKYLGRTAAGVYLKERYGFGAPRTLAKLATVGGGPKFHKAGRVVLYTLEALDEWAGARIGPERESTSDVLRRRAV
jgi:hypothetical protein